MKLESLVRREKEAKKLPRQEENAHHFNDAEPKHENDVVPKPVGGVHDKFESKLNTAGSKVHDADLPFPKTKVDTLVKPISSKFRPSLQPHHTSIPVETGSVNPSLQKEDIKQMLDEAIDDVKLSVQGSIRDLHVEILRQFQMQMNDMEAMLHDNASKIETLAKENQELRKENPM